MIPPSIYIPYFTLPFISCWKYLLGYYHCGWPYSLLSLAVEVTVSNISWERLPSRGQASKRNGITAKNQKARLRRHPKKTTIETQ
jgi:hypothetical protein